MRSVGLKVVCQLMVLAFLMASALAQEVVSAEEFAARCAAGGGNLTLNRSLRVESGMAEMGACTVNLRRFQLEILDAQLAFAGHFATRGAQGSEVRLDRSILYQDHTPAELVHIALVANQVRVQDSAIRFNGNVHLVGDNWVTEDPLGLLPPLPGRTDGGNVLVEVSDIFSIYSDVLMAASRNGLGGKIDVKKSRVFGEGDIMMEAGNRLGGLRGEIKIEYNAIVAWHDIRMQTGTTGSVLVRRNFQPFEIFGETFNGIDTMATLTISSELIGQTDVFENRVVAHKGVLIRSQGQTRTRENNFDGSGPVVVRGLLCESADNNPDVACQ